MNSSSFQRHIREVKAAVRTQYLSFALCLINYLLVDHNSTLYGPRHLKVYLNTLRRNVFVRWMTENQFRAWVRVLLAVNSGSPNFLPVNQERMLLFEFYRLHTAYRNKSWKDSNTRVETHGLPQTSITKAEKKKHAMLQLQLLLVAQSKGEVRPSESKGCTGSEATPQKARFARNMSLSEEFCNCTLHSQTLWIPPDQFPT